MLNCGFKTLTFFASVALLFEIISLTTAVWVWSPLDSKGLWEYCFAGFCSSFIGTFQEEWFHWPTRIFAIIATILLLIAVIHCFRVLFLNYSLDAWITAKGLPGSFALAAIMEIIALSFFTSNVDPILDIFYGYSYILGWLSAVMCIFLAIGSGLTKQINAILPL